MSLEQLKNNWHQIQYELKDLLNSLGRDETSCKVIAVTKQIEVETIKKLIEIGATDIGENRVQEAKSKYDFLKDLPCKWHFIGSLQTNKAKYVVQMFQFIHSVDREELLNVLGRLSIEKNLYLNILFQVNVSGKINQSGCTPNQLDKLIELALKFQNLNLNGLMCIASPIEEVGEKKVQEQFAFLRNLLIKMNDKFHLDNFTELSMGMSSDWKYAVKEGATMVRIGTAIFGERLKQ